MSTSVGVVESHHSKDIETFVECISNKMTSLDQIRPSAMLHG